MILTKIIKIVATRCQILRLKCTKFDFGWAPPRPHWGSLQCSADPLAGFKGPLKGREGRGGNGMGGKRREGERKGKRERNKRQIFRIGTVYYAEGL